MNQTNKPPSKKQIWIAAQWPAPENIHAGTTTRLGGVSKNNYCSLNLAIHVEDNPQHVIQNRQRLIHTLSLPGEPVWLTQTHSNRIVNLDVSPVDLQADGAISRTARTVCCILTADCLPLLICDTSGTQIAAVHVGWRGLCSGIIDNALKFFADTDEIIVWIGPGISARHYEVGIDMRDTCIKHLPGSEVAFSPNRNGHWLADLKMMARLNLQKLGVGSVYDSNLCTYADDRQFYSHRRDGLCGRMASLIWMD